ncbi:MAG: NFACT family protein [Clostridia bacterium]|nr:NFACT family protein [Clostridia bacterium]
MALDGIVLNSLKNELLNKITDARVDKIYQPESAEIVLQLRCFRETYKLFLSADPMYPRINLTNESYKNPDTPPLFCMLLRKHISSAKIIGIEQVGTDRILKIIFETYNEMGDLVNKTLVIEIMGRFSNIMLVNEKGIIVDCIKRIDLTVSSKRQVLPGLFYEAPPEQDKLNFLEFDEAVLKDKLYINEDVLADKFLMNTFDGVAPIVSREICYRTFGELNVILTASDTGKKDRLYNNIIDYFSNPDAGKYCILWDRENNAPKYFSSVDITQYGEAFDKKFYNSPSEMLDVYFSQLHFSRCISQRSAVLTKTLKNLIEKTERKIAIHTEVLAKSEDKEKYRLFGELITANMYMLKGGETEVEVINYYDGNPVTIKLNEFLSPAKNAQKYYNEYQKAKKAEEVSGKILAELKDELYYLESELEFLNKAQDQSDIDAIKEELSKEGFIRHKNGNNRKKAKKISTTYNEFISSDGFLIYVGKNNNQNDELTFKVASPNDLWLHIKTYPGSHTIVKTNGSEIPDSTLLEAATLAAVYSKGSPGTKITIDYTKAKFVKKPPGAKPGMVTYSNFKSVVVISDESIITKLKK